MRMARSAAPATLGSCVAMTKVVPVAWRRSRIICSTLSLFFWSRLPVGSSMITMAGLVASARATATRCCSPPESWFGRLRSRWPSPTSVSSLCGARGGAAGVLADVERHLDVLLRGERRDQVEGLKDHADLLVAHGGQLALAHLGDVDAVDQHLAAGRVIQPGDDAEQGGFARAGWPDDGDELAMLDAQADALEDVDALAPQRQRLANVNALRAPRRHLVFARAPQSLPQSAPCGDVSLCGRAKLARVPACLPSATSSALRHGTWPEAVTLRTWRLRLCYTFGKTRAARSGADGSASARHPRSGNERPPRH